ncbi:hypothetical protein AYO40_05770 [Planctomycetaceae bacterium SCGC AG-212-D15]|nr:hypothetical protein AYO40_05770 [Planctomycetaceae bacterium SCGC AG-212-D15]
MPQDNYPIQFVTPSKNDFVPDSSTGRAWEPFGEVNDTVRARLASEIHKVTTHLQSLPKTPGVPGVAKVTLKREALAKTYRPDDILNSSTCPIIGANKLGELLIAATPTGLASLERTLQSTAQTAIAQISTLEHITPYTTRDVLGAKTADDVADESKAKKETRLRVRLFRHNSPHINSTIDAAFKALAMHLNAEQVEEMPYAESIRVFCVKNMPSSNIVQLASFAGTQSLSSFPRFGIVRPASVPRGSVSPSQFPGPVAGVQYPIVGMFDSGTDRKNQLLQSWVVGRYDAVPVATQNNDHGSLVAGLMVHARRLNNGDKRFPNVSSKIVDVVAFDKTGEIDEYDLLPIIDYSLLKFKNVKVWNLSLSIADTPCKDHEFSEIATALDERSNKHGVVFVVAAGNYKEEPFREWPPQDGIDENDRISPPADSVRAITVGSVAHAHARTSRVRTGEPSPFSRRGPGPAYLPKPEITYYGGNCDQAGNAIQTGVISVNGSGQLVETVGTSFATPLASTVAAHLYHELSVDPSKVSPSLVKALMVHAAFLNSAPLDEELFNYCGAGTPPQVDEILECNKWRCTLILDVAVRSRLIFGKRPFPMPECLIKKDKFVGEVFMTLGYDPPMSRAFGIEYCRTNVSASLGIMKLKEGKPAYSREIPPSPKSLSSAYEEELVKHGYKWSPLKLYHRRYPRGGPGVRNWRLTLEMLSRAESPVTTQRATLVVTVQDPNRIAPVYRQMVQDMQREQWSMHELALRSRAGRIQS